MRVAHVDEREAEVASGNVQGRVHGVIGEVGELLAAESGHTHVDGDRVAFAERGHDLAGGRLQDDRVAGQQALHLQLAGHHAHAVAAHLGLATVRVEDLQPVAVRAGLGTHDQDPVGADAEVAVTEETHTLRSQLEGYLLAVQHDVGVAQALPFGELHLAQTLPLGLHAWILLQMRRRAMSAATSAGERPPAGILTASGSFLIQVSWRLT